MSLPDTSADRRAQLIRDLDQRILCLDGATGTWFQAQDLSASDFGGEQFEGCNENLVLTRPDLILDLHRAYLKAGADIIETNTFGGTPIVLAEYPPLQTKAYEINRRAAELARQAAAEFDTDHLHYVAGSIGPTTKAISVTGGVTFSELIENFEAQAAALLDGGVDYLLLETCQDTRNIKAALCAIDLAGGGGGTDYAQSTHGEAAEDPGDPIPHGGRGSSVPAWLGFCARPSVSRGRLVREVFVGHSELPRAAPLKMQA